MATKNEVEWLMPPTAGRTDLDDLEAPPPYIERGTTGLKHSSGTVWDEWHKKLRGRFAIKNYREMSDNDPVIGSALYGMGAFISQAPVEIEPADDSPMAAMIAEHITSCLDDMKMTKSDLMSNVLSMLWAGYSLHSIVVKLRRGVDAVIPEFRSKHDDGLVGWYNLPIRAQDTIDRWEIQDNGDIIAAIQVAYPKLTPTRLDLRDSLLFRNRSNKNNPEGRSLLRPAWRPWWFLKRIQEFEAIGIERDMAGQLVFRLPPSYFQADAKSTQKTTVANYRKLAQRFRAGEHSGLAFPAADDAKGKTGFDVELLQSGGRRPMDVDGVIRRLESRIALALMAEVSLLGLQGSVGSWALADVKERMGMLALRAITDAIADVMNRYAIPRLVELNHWPVQLSPKWVFGDIDTNTIIASLPSMVQAVTAGLLTPEPQTEAFIRTRLGLPAGDDLSLGQLQDAVGGLTEHQAEDPNEDAAEAEGALAEAIPIVAEEKMSMTADEAADFLGVSRSVINNAIRNGKIPGRKIGGSYRIVRSDLIDFMQNRQEAA